MRPKSPKRGLKTLPSAPEVTSAERWLTLPREHQLIPISKLHVFLERAIDDHLHAHEGESIQKALEFGFSNESLEIENIARAVVLLRDAGLIQVREADGLGSINDARVERGWLSRKDLAVLLTKEWNMALRDEYGNVPSMAIEPLPNPKFAIQDKRLSDLRVLGGNVVCRNGQWQLDPKRRGPLTKLASQEAEAGRPRSDRGYVKEDCIDAAMRESARG